MVGPVHIAGRKLPRSGPVGSQWWDVSSPSLAYRKSLDVEGIENYSFENVARKRQADQPLMFSSFVSGGHPPWRSQVSVIFLRPRFPPSAQALTRILRSPACRRWIDHRATVWIDTRCTPETTRCTTDTCRSTRVSGDRFGFQIAKIRHSACSTE